MSKRPEPAPVAIETIERKKNLVSSLVEAMEREIIEGRLKPGDRLPSEVALASSAGVSRTVVREAVAALKAASLVETRQGAGAFVRAQPAGFVAPRGIRKATLDEILSMLELRMAVEVEAAALAAQRRSEADIAALDAAIERMREETGAGGDALESDLAFHRAIATATQNRYFSEFLGNLGDLAMPRKHLARASVDTSQMRSHLLLVRTEHRGIREAIAARDSTLAAATMRGHLAGSRARYATLAGDAGEGGETGD